MKSQNKKYSLNIPYPIVLTGLVVEFVDTVVVHIQRICNIRLYLVLLGCVDLDGCNCHHIVVYKIKSIHFYNPQTKLWKGMFLHMSVILWAVCPTWMLTPNKQADSPSLEATPQHTVNIQYASYWNASLFQYDVYRFMKIF